jgi:hypothetical protein
MQFGEVFKRLRVLGELSEDGVRTHDFAHAGESDAQLRRSRWMFCDKGCERLRFATARPRLQPKRLGQVFAKYLPGIGGATCCRCIAPFAPKLMRRLDCSYYEGPITWIRSK